MEQASREEVGTQLVVRRERRPQVGGARARGALTTCPRCAGCVQKAGGGGGEQRGGLHAAQWGP